MHVLMQMNAEGFSIPGGHRRQMEKTAEYVRLLGITVDTTSSADLDLTDYDIVHIFGFGSSIFDTSRLYKKPTALTPVYWSNDYFLNYAQMSGRTSARIQDYKYRIRTAASVLLKGRNAIFNHASFWIHHAENASICRMADVLLPNAYAEGEDLVRECKVSPRNLHFVPNAVDAKLLSAKPDLFYDTYGVRDFVLCVGRVEPRKNQYRLIHAVRQAGLRLVIIDPVHSDHAAYLGQCQKAFSRDTIYLQKVTEAMLHSAYAAARVHALPSFFETTGLASLEAGLVGCNLVVGEQRHTHEYFQTYAQYCNPYDIRSIREAVERAYTTSFSEGLRQRILDNFTWEHTATSTIKAYEWVLTSVA